MKTIFLLFLATIYLQLPGMAQDASPYFASNPALTPDGETLIFSYDGDLWKASAAGGVSTRITAMQGTASNPRVSPDGKWLAFSNSQFGNADVYVMPLQGGDIKRLTFHAANDMMESWTWDSKSVYFTSNRYNRMSTYKVNIDGGTPQRVFNNNMFDYTHNAFEDPVTGEIFFDDTWESSFFANRIGYKGPFNPDIQSYNPATKKYKR
jgi:tricorn protease